MISPSPQYDVAIIGSGIAGSSLGAILARHGLRVLVLEAKSHPRFSIGESMILETSETMRAIAELFDIPEMAYYSSERYLPCIGTSHGVKRHFSFLYHVPGRRQDPAHALQAVIPKQPHGHELHLYRQDTDAHLTAVAVAYGATVLQNTPVQNVQLQPDAVTVVTADGRTFAAAYVVDAGGYRSILAERHHLRTTALRTHSRSLFTHMVGVPCFHDVGAPPAEYGMPFRVSEGTLHHLFDGGWLWVIPFNNHPRSTNPLCSVGLLLDPRRHPPRPDLSPAEEFGAFIGQFPDIAAQFLAARAVRDWTRTGRIQYSSTQIVGDRWCLLGHAAGFIDPLFSKGLYVTMMSVGVLANLLLDATRDGVYGRDRFAPLERLTLAYVQANDHLVAASYRAFADSKLWQVTSVLWLLGAYTEYVKLLAMRTHARTRAEYFGIGMAHTLSLVGGGFPGFDALATRVYGVLDRVDPHAEREVDAAVAEITALYTEIDWMPLPFQAVLHGKITLPKFKIRPDLLGREAGFLRGGAYRAHFFGDRSLVDVAAAFVRERLKYSAWVVQRRRHVDYAAKLPWTG